MRGQKVSQTTRLVEFIKDPRASKVTSNQNKRLPRSILLSLETVTAVATMSFTFDLLSFLPSTTFLPHLNSIQSIFLLLLVSAKIISGDDDCNTELKEESSFAHYTHPYQNSKHHINLAPDYEHAPFVHGVGSMDPMPKGIILWTRVNPEFLKGGKFDAYLNSDLTSLFSSSTKRKFRSSPFNLNSNFEAIAATKEKSRNYHQKKEQHKFPRSSSLSIKWSVWPLLDISDQYGNYYSFAHPIQSGVEYAYPEKDYTVQVMVDGLEENTRYYYQFALWIDDDKEKILNEARNKSEIGNKLQYTEEVNSGARNSTLHQNLADNSEGKVVFESSYHDGDPSTRKLSFSVATSSSSMRFDKALDAISSTAKNTTPKDRPESPNDSSLGHWRYSVRGKTKTSGGSSDSVKIAFLSCTSLWSGYFNVYRHLAKNFDGHDQDESLDAVIHLGDFIYPDIDPQEVYRVPHGMNKCKNHELVDRWGFSKFSLGHATDNLDPYVQTFVELELNCSVSSEPDWNKTTLNLFRWVHRLYTLDPDLRAARANHPFIFSLDNHDIGYVNENYHDVSRQAAWEYIPQRTTNMMAKDGHSYEATHRSFRFGANMTDLFMLDTHCESDNEESQGGDGGLLGNGQHEWLDRVLKNSSESKVHWRIFGSPKTFMPVVLNRAGSSVIVFFLPFLIALAGGLALCLAIEFLIFSKSQHKQYSRVSINDYHEGRLSMTSTYRRKNTDDVDDWVKQELIKESAAPASYISHSQKESSSNRGSPVVKVGYLVADEVREIVATVKAVNEQTPPILRWFCFFFWTLLVIIAVLWAGSAAYLGATLNTKDINYLFAKVYNWDGQPQSRNRLFDQLESTNTDINNIWATGDMHLSYAADVFRFDPNDKYTLLNYSPRNWHVKRYGVEMIAASGTRGNIDETFGGICDFLKPHRFLSRWFYPLLNRFIKLANRQYRYYDGTHHGYGLLSISRVKVKADFYQFPILHSSDEFKIGQTLFLKKGENKWSRR